MTYIEKHWKIFLKSVKLDALAFKLFVTDILFILTLILAYVMLYALWIKNVLSVSTILGIGENVPTISNLDVVSIWNVFITQIIFILITGVLLYVSLLSIYSAFSHTFMNTKGFTLKLVLNFLGIYSLLTIIYLLLIILMFFSSQNVMFIAWSIVLVTLLYLYSLLIFYLVTSGGSFIKIIHHGFRSMIRLHEIIIPLTLGFLLMTLSLSLIGILFKGKPVMLAVLVTGVFLYLATWLKKYLHHILHETR